MRYFINISNMCLQQKKDGTPDKHKPKDTWTVESANGSGFQKLKIRLQRFPDTASR